MRPAPREWLLLLVLSGIQFSQMVDFMVLMPLGTQLMRSFDITPTQLGFFVSIYAVAASLSGFFSALVIDRFDRKTAMLALYACFAATMAACALAPGYATLLAARTAAGAFGGVVAANIFTIVADVVPENRRGRAFGAVMSAFSLASIAGVPISLYLALHFTWRAPYVFLAALCSAILLAAWFAIPPVRAHLTAGGERNALARIRAVFGETNHLRIFAFSALLVFSGFLVFPFIAPYLVTNVGVSEAQLPLVYLVAGIAALLTARLVGGWSDSVGRRAVFAVAAVATGVAAIAVPRRGARLHAHVCRVLGAHGARDGAHRLGRRAAPARQRDELQFLHPAARRRRGFLHRQRRRGALGRGRADPLLDDRHPLGRGDVRVHRARPPGALGGSALT